MNPNLNVHNTSLETRKTLSDEIKRIAENVGRVAGLPDDKLPEVTVLDESVPPTINDAKMAQRLRAVWVDKTGKKILSDKPNKGMAAHACRVTIAHYSKSLLSQPLLAVLKPLF